MFCLSKEFTFFGASSIFRTIFRPRCLNYVRMWAVIQSAPDIFYL